MESLLFLSCVLKQTTAPQRSETQSVPAGISADARCFKSPGSGNAWERARSHCRYPWEQRQRLCFEAAALSPVAALLVKGELFRLAGC